MFKDAFFRLRLQVKGEKKKTYTPCTPGHTKEAAVTDVSLPIMTGNNSKVQRQMYKPSSGNHRSHLRFCLLWCDLSFRHQPCWIRIPSKTAKDETECQQNLPSLVYQIMPGRTVVSCDVCYERWDKNRGRWATNTQKDQSNISLDTPGKWQILEYSRCSILPKEMIQLSNLISLLSPRPGGKK